MLSLSLKFFQGFRLEHLHLTLAHSKGQSHAHFNCEYLVNGYICEKHYYYHHIQGNVKAFDWHI